MALKNSVILTSGLTLSAFLGFITLPAVAWLFNAEDVGKLSLLQAVIGLGVTLFSLQLHQSYVREFYETENRSELLKVTLVTSLAFLFLSILFLLPFLNQFSVLLFESYDKYQNLSLIIALICALIMIIFTHVFRMKKRITFFVLANNLNKICFLGLILLSYVLDFDKTFAFLSISYAAAYFVTFLFSTIALKRDLRDMVFAPFNFDLAKTTLKFGCPLIVGGICYWGLMVGNRFLIQSISGLEVLAQYSVATSIAAGAAIISSIFATLWHPTLYRWAKEGLEISKISSVFSGMFLICALIWSLVGLFSGAIKFFLPSQYAGVEFLITGCVTVPLLYMLSETTVFGITLARKTAFAMLASTVAFCLSIMLGFIFIQYFDAKGATLASMLSLFCFFILRTEFSVVLYSSFPRIKIYILLICYIFITSLIMFAEVGGVNSALIWISVFFVSLFALRKEFWGSFSTFMEIIRV